MKNSIQTIQRQLSRLRALVPPEESLREFVSCALNEQIASVASDAPMGIVPPSVLSMTQLLASARMAAELIEAPERLAEKPEGIVDIGVMDWLLRPALQLRNDVLDPIESGIWKHLAPDAVTSQSSVVCRLDVSIDGSDPIQIGTGFVAGEDARGRLVIATNAHVVDEVVRIGWPANEQIALSCDFSRFSVDIGGERHRVEMEYELHPSYDIGLLHLRRDSMHGDECIVPLQIATSAPENVFELKIGVIGHPAFDSRRDPFPQFFGFGNEFGVKRFSPGLVRTLDERLWRGSDVRVFLHDATTLSGSSGSCILDLEAMNVVGLHFGGWPLPKRRVKTHTGDAIASLFEANGAVPMWMLAQDTFCSDLAFG